MKIGIIGVGIITMDFAHKAAMSGYEVLISGLCHSGILRELALKMGDNVKAATIQEVASSEIIILFSAFESLEILIAALPNMKGKVILHTNNVILSPACLLLPRLTGNSSCALLASRLPTAHIVKIFTISGPTINSTNNQNQNTSEIYFTTKNKKAEHTTKIFFNSLGFSSSDLSELYFN